LQGNDQVSAQRGVGDYDEASAILEASAWAMLIAGFGLGGFASRRRRTSVAA
jgi:hypothetical protein